METSNIKIHADYQKLTVGSGVKRYASNTVSYVFAEFDLGNGWQDFDAVQAIWKSKYDTIRVLLDNEGHCMVPQEVLSRESKVQVNLVGFTSDGETLTSRLTSYPVFVLDVDAKAELDGSRSEEITPTQFERFVSQVAERARLASEFASNASESADRAQTSESAAAASEISALNSMTSASDSELSAAESADRAEAAKAFLESASAEATTLTPGSQATASYSEGVFRFGIPQGQKGDTGAQGPQGIQGPKGDKGEQGDVNIEQLRALLPTETVSGDMVSITDGQSVVPADSLEVSLSPIQDLNGYDKPWVGGAGKNKLPMTLASLKAVNTSATWSGNTYTRNGITFTVLTDANDNVTGIRANGTATEGTAFYQINNRKLPLVSGQYAFNGCPSDGSDTTYRLQARIGSAWFSETGSGRTFSYDASTTDTDLVRISILSGAVCNNVVFKPMIRLASETDATYEPYSNICPISGRTEVVTQRTGKNLLPTLTNTTTVAGVTYTPQSDGSVTAVGTSTGVQACYLANYVRGLLPAGNYIVTAGEDASADLRLIVAVYANPTKYYEVTSASGKELQYDGVSSISVYMRTNGGNKAINGTIYPMVRLASDADASYEPYNGQTYTTALGQTVYGGTLDVVSGMLTVDRLFHTVNPNDITSVAPLTNNVRSGLYRPQALADNPSTGENADAISNLLPKVVKNYSADVTGFYFFDATGVYIKLPKTSLSTVDLTGFRQFLTDHPMEIVYPLATPQTYQLTPKQIDLLLGTNNVWSDGEITLVYGADIQRYIEKKLNA